MVLIFDSCRAITVSMSPYLIVKVFSSFSYHACVIVPFRLFCFNISVHNVSWSYDQYFVLWALPHIT